MKKILVLMCILSLLPAYSYGASMNVEKGTDRSIYSEYIKEMNSFGLDASLIVDKKEENGKIYYLYDYGEFSEYVNVEKNNMSTVFNIEQDDIKNEVIIYNDGDIYLNGHKVRVTFTDTERVSAGYKRIYKGFKPYGSLTASSYSKFLASGRQNIELGERMDRITASTLGIILKRTNFWIGLAVDASKTFVNIYNTLKPQKPESKMLGCEYTTYVSGSENYKYILNYYPDAKCQGTASKVILYETFRVV